MFEDRELRLSEPRCIAATGDKTGEGIFWASETESVYWTDINRFLVHRYSTRDRLLRTWFFSEPVTCVLATNRRGTLALVLGSGVILWKPETDERLERIFDLPGWPSVRCNDAAIDPRGALWIGSMRNNVGSDGSPGEVGGEDGVLYHIDPGGASTVRKRDIGIGNTLAWSPDQTKFYFGDSLKNRLWSFGYDRSDGSIAAEQIFFEGFERGVPDGSAVDEHGYLWNCRYGGGCIVRVAPNGKVDRVIELPVANVTNCAFGGADGQALYVTSASPDSGKWERFGGCLFVMETSVAGLPDNQFACF
jgi:sugar lactone lactonase YvrE